MKKNHLVPLPSTDATITQVLANRAEPIENGIEGVIRIGSPNGGFRRYFRVRFPEFCEYDGEYIESCFRDLRQLLDIAYQETKTNKKGRV